MRKTRQKLLATINDQLTIYTLSKQMKPQNDFENGYNTGAINALKTVLLFAGEKTTKELWPSDEQ